MTGPFKTHFGSAALLLALTVPGLTADNPPADLTAAEALDRARAARATWTDFPGFTAELSVAQDSVRATGSLRVAADGQVTLAGLERLDVANLTRQLSSLIGHRLPSAGTGEDVEWAADAAPHPLGRLMRIVGDEQYRSSYRLRDDVIAQVHRETAETRFTISVLDVTRNAEGKYLPATFGVTFWNPADGQITSTETHVNEWRRVGRYDLPARVVVARSTRDGTSVTELSFTAHKLASPAAADEAQR